MNIVYVLEVLDDCMEWQLDSLFKTREKALEYVKEKYPDSTYYVSEFEVY